MIDCDWSVPGRDAYTGTPAAAIIAMSEIPMPVQQALIARAEAHDFDDAVMIDRDSIRSPKHAYAPELRSMAFGSHGKVCATVTRAGWAPDRVESAMVFCEGGWCIARPSICNNWAIVTRRVPAPIAGPTALPALADADESSAVHGTPEWPAFNTANESFEAQQTGAWGAFSTWAVVSTGSTCCAPCGPVPAVPEPGTWALLVAGLALVAARGRHGR